MTRTRRRFRAARVEAMVGRSGTDTVVGATEEGALVLAVEMVIPTARIARIMAASRPTIT
jgi:hypothetical protein